MPNSSLTKMRIVIILGALILLCPTVYSVLLIKQSAYMHYDVLVANCQRPLTKLFHNTFAIRHINKCFIF